MCVGEGGREGTRDGGKGGVKEIECNFFLKLNIVE